VEVGDDVGGVIVIGDKTRPFNLGIAYVGSERAIADSRDVEPPIVTTLFEVLLYMARAVPSIGVVDAAVVVAVKVVAAVDVDVVAVAVSESAARLLRAEL